MKQYLRILMPIAIVAAAIFGLIGQTVWGIVAVALSLAIGLWQHFESEQSSRTQESLNDVQARMMLKQGMGNVYSEAALQSLEEGQGVVGAQITKALQLDPNDRFALMAWSATNALNLSTRIGHGERIEQTILNAVRKACRRGHKHYPDEGLFASSLGILADCEGHHEIARLWFQKAGALAPAGDQYWRLSMATSYAMSHDFDQAYEQVDEAIKSGVLAWFASFYMGRTLCSLGKYDEGLNFLTMARKRRFHPDILSCLRDAHFNLGNSVKAVYYDCLFTIALLVREPKNGLRAIPSTVIFLVGIGLGKLRRAAYFLLAPIVRNRPMLARLLRPDEIEISISADLLHQKHFKAAEDICRAGLKAIPDSYRLLCQLAGSLALQDRRDEALAEFDKALILYPDDPILKWNRSQCAGNTKLNVPLVDR